MAKKNAYFVLSKLMETLKKDIIEYLSKGFGEVQGIKNALLPSTVPLLVTSSYKFFECNILGVDCILAVAAENATHTPRRVQKQLSLVKECMKKPVVFAARNLQPHDKSRFFALRVPLVVPGKVAYLPFAGALQETARREFIVNSSTLSAVAQQVVIGYLEHRIGSPICVKDASELLSYSPPAIQNAFRELEYFGLGERTRRPSAHALEFVFAANGRELWEKAKPLLTSPVRKVVGLATPPKDTDGCVVAGVDALATFGRLNEQPPSVYATAQNGFAKRGYEVISTLGAPFQLQLWAYDPQRLGGKGGIDILSLVLSLHGERDDRVQIEIERAIEEFKW